MERVIGGIVGLASFAAVTAAGLQRGLAFGECAWRALAAMALGYLAGRWLVGPAGRVVAREAAGPPPAGPPAGQGPPPAEGAGPPEAA
jgi:hypothetical protein